MGAYQTPKTTGIKGVWYAGMGEKGAGEAEDLDFLLGRQRHLEGKGGGVGGGILDGGWEGLMWGEGSLNLPLSCGNEL